MIVAHLVGKFHSLLWNTEVHYRVHKIPPLDPSLSQTNPGRILTHFLKVLLNIILLPVPWFPKWSHPFRFSDENFVCIFHLLHAWYMYHVSHPPWFYHANKMYSFVFRYLLSLSLSLPPLVQIFSSVPVPKQSFLRLGDQVSHPYKNITGLPSPLRLHLWIRDCFPCVKCCIPHTRKWVLMSRPAPSASTAPNFSPVFVTVDAAPFQIS
jgi:hypothetical protein